MKSSNSDKKSKPELRKFFVPGIGEVEATDLEDAAKQAEKLKEKQEDTDGDD